MTLPILIVGAFIITVTLILIFAFDMYCTKKYYEAKEHSERKDKYMFGEKLKVIRTTLRLSQEEFGDFFGVTKQCIGYWERDKRDIPNHALKKLQEVCKGTSFSPILFLFGRCDKPFGESETHSSSISIIRNKIINPK